MLMEGFGEWEASYTALSRALAISPKIPLLWQTAKKEFSSSTMLINLQK
jgi:hypothetical protein